MKDTLFSNPQHLTISLTRSKQEFYKLNDNIINQGGNMANSIFIAKIIGPCCIIMGIGLLLNRNFYVKFMEDFAKNDALILISGMMSLIIGLLIIASHNMWVSNWKVIITLFGWAGLLKGIWLCVFPKSISGFITVYQKNSGLLLVHSIIAILFGIFLSYVAYF